MRAHAIAAAVALSCGRLGLDTARIGDDAPPLPDAAVPPALVQVIAPGYGSAASRSITIDATAGDVLVAAMYWDQSPDTIALADTAGLAWMMLPIEGVVAGCGGVTGNATGEQLAYARVAASGTDTITVTQTAVTHPLGIFVLEYAGIAAVVVEANAGAVAPSASNAMALPAVTATGADIVVAFFNDTVGTGACTAGAGYTLRANDPGFPNVIEDAIVPAGSYAPIAALPPGHNDACWVGTVVALRAH